RTGIPEGSRHRTGSVHPHHRTDDDLHRLLRRRCPHPRDRHPDVLDVPRADGIRPVMAAALPTTAIPVVTETHLAEVLDDHESDVTAKPRHSIAAVWAGVSGAVMVPVALSFAP